MTRAEFIPARNELEGPVAALFRPVMPGRVPLTHREAVLQHAQMHRRTGAETGVAALGPRLEAFCLRRGGAEQRTHREQSECPQ